MFYSVEYKNCRYELKLLNKNNNKVESNTWDIKTLLTKLCLNAYDN